MLSSPVCSFCFNLWGFCLFVFRRLVFLLLYPNKAIFFLLLSHNCFFREETDERIIPCQQDLYLGDTQFLIWLKHRLTVLACILLYQSLLFWSHFKEHNGIQSFSMLLQQWGWIWMSFTELQTWFTAAAGLKIHNQMFRCEVSSF